MQERLKELEPRIAKVAEAEKSLSVEKAKLQEAARAQAEGLL